MRAPEIGVNKNYSHRLLSCGCDCTGVKINNQAVQTVIEQKISSNLLKIRAGLVCEN